LKKFSQYFLATHIERQHNGKQKNLEHPAFTRALKARTHFGLLHDKKNLFATDLEKMLQTANRSKRLYIKSYSDEHDDPEGKTAEKIQEMLEEGEATARATILEILIDIPDTDMAPPKNGLNPSACRIAADDKELDNTEGEMKFGEKK
jgi:hypothetical protein